MKNASRRPPVHPGRILAGELDEVRALRRRLAEENPVVGEDRHRVALDPGEAADQGLGVQLLELVEPAGDASPVSRFLEKGGGLHHLCYEVTDLGEHLKLIRAAGCVVVRAPMPAAAFQQRLIAWAWTREKLLLEFLEAAKT